MRPRIARSGSERGPGPGGAGDRSTGKPGPLKLAIRPLTPDRWPALQDLFGKSGASNGCWCMYWRIGSAYGKRPRARNRAAFRRVVRRGPPPGLLAFDGHLVVGWCQLTPRAALPTHGSARLFGPVNEVTVWSPMM